jgi:CRISPR-associated protein Cas6
MNPIVDVFFGVRGSHISVDHGYALYGAIARLLETPGDGWLHKLDEVGLHLLRGSYGSHGRLLLGPHARFGLRLSAALVPKVLALAGKRLIIGVDTLQVGVPHVQALRPMPVLMARLVTTRNGQDEQRFDCEVARQLSELGITAPATRGRRRVIRIKDKTVVGYSVHIAALSAAESLRLQEHGLGGRRKMGCGVFVRCVGAKE